MRSAPIPVLLLRAAAPVAARCVVAGDLAAGILFKPQDGTNGLAQDAGSHMARLDPANPESGLALTPDPDRNQTGRDVEPFRTPGRFPGRRRRDPDADAL